MRHHMELRTAAVCWGLALAACTGFVACSGDDSPLVGEPGPGTGEGTGGDRFGDDDASAGGSGGSAGGAAGSGGVETGGSAGQPDGGSGGSGDECSTNDDCASSPDTPYCDTFGTCVACEETNSAHACASGLTCCGTSCVNTSSDIANCGACGAQCNLLNANPSCAAGSCGIASCAPGFENCDQNPANGCESAEGSCSCVPNASEPCYDGPAGTLGVGLCLAGIRTCNASGTGWGNCVGQILPVADTCGNILDDDCDGVVNNGFPNVADCACLPGSTVPCYSGAPGTENVGECKGGTRTCAPSGTGYDFCQGEVTPGFEICANGKDEDCNNIVDDSLDEDGDGWTVCQGDCCDRAGAVCQSPALVNPGAFDVVGNNVDDDCDGTKDNGVGTCDGALASNSASAADYAKAIDLCQTATLADKKWGVISAQFALANASGTPAAASRSIRNGFGTNVTPRLGARLAVLSTGNAADRTDTNPAYAAFQGGVDTGTSSAVPSDWLAANGNNFPNAPGCPDPQGGTTAHNPIMLRVQVRVPTNARSFAVSTYFYSSEYPEWVCSPFNDFFVALLDSTFSGAPPNPTDKNLAFYDPPPLGAPFYPIGVNLAYGNTGLFRQCLNGATGCGGGSLAGTTSACTSTTELAGTGFEIANPPPHSGFPDEPGWCGTNNLLGGGTGWLTTRGNVTPGEVITLRFVIWDTGDPWYDSLVLLDNFVWSLDASQPGTGG